MSCEFPTIDGPKTGPSAKSDFTSLAVALKSGGRSHRFQHFLRWRPLWHREQDFVNELWRWPTGLSVQIRTTTIFDNVQIPIVDQCSLDALSAQTLSIIGFDLELALAAQVFEVLLVRAKQLLEGYTPS